MKVTRKTPAAAFTALALASTLAAQTGELVVIQETGPRDKRVNLVIIGDGYRAAEKNLFLDHARVFAKGVVEDPPLAGYKDYFNVYAIFVASVESGADIPGQNITRNTHFNAHYDASLGRLLVIDNAKGNAVINGLVPERDISAAVVNSSQYGGSGGSIAVANYSAPEIIAHEAQHSFTNLGDEYDYPGTRPWETHNTTKNGTRAAVTWKHWVQASTPVPTPETTAWSTAVGVFEGAAYNTTGWFRPMLTCRMKENGKPFCPVCSEAILLQVYDRVSPLDSSLPAQRSVTANPGVPPGLRIVAKQPTTHALKVEWYLDGQLVAGMAGPAFTQPLAPGRHRVMAKVLDPTPLVKQDLALVLQDTASWEVTVGGITAVAGGEAGAMPLEIVSASRSRVDFRLPAAGAYRLSAFAPDGRGIWEHAGIAGLSGLQSLPAGGILAGTGDAGRGLAVFRLEQGGRSARFRVLLME